MGGRGVQHVVTPDTVKVLEMTVLSAKGLAISTRLGRLMSLYVRISLDGKQRQTTKCVRSCGPEPEWNEKLFFNLDEDTLARPLDPSRRLITPDDDSAGFLIEIYQGRPLSRKLLGAQILSVMQAIEFSNSGFTYHTLCLRGSEAYINLGLRLTDPTMPAGQDVEMQPGCSPTSHLRSNSCVRRPAVLGMTLDHSGAGVAMMRSPPPQLGAVAAANTCQQPSTNMSVKKAAAAAVANMGLSPRQHSSVAPPPPMQEHVLAFGRGSEKNERSKTPPPAGAEALTRVLSIGNSSRKRVEASPVRPQFRSGSSKVSAEPSGSHRGASAYDSNNMPPVRLIKRPGLAFSTKGPPLPKLVVPYRDRAVLSQGNGNGSKGTCTTCKAGDMAEPLDRCSSENENACEGSGTPVNGQGRAAEEVQPLARSLKSGGCPRRPQSIAAVANLNQNMSPSASVGVDFKPLSPIANGGAGVAMECLASGASSVGRDRGSLRDHHHDRWHLSPVLEVEETCLTPTYRACPPNAASSLTDDGKVERCGRASSIHASSEEGETAVKFIEPSAVAAVTVSPLSVEV